MKILIDESQKNKLEELTAAGSWGKTDVDEKVFRLISQKISARKITELTKKYFGTVLGSDISGYENFYFSDFIDSYDNDFNLYPKSWKTPDAISGLGYFLVKNGLNLQQGNYGLEYYRDKKTGWSDYYFFDGELELTIGYISILKFDKGYRHEIYKKFPKETYRVSLSMIDDKLIGLGYGKNMYLTILDNVSCLMSDDVLYKGSINIWVHALPRYVKYVGFVSSEKELVKLPTKKRLRYGDIDCFFASNTVNIFS